MSEWGSGYVTDLEYGSGFYKEQAPGHLRLACQLLGVEPGPIESGFTYCELGCGDGTTSLILAAANPEGRFVGVDFNPAHIMHARELARASGLTNIEFHDCGFDELAEGRGPPMPAFDFITLHGVYSWVGPDVRASIVRFMGMTLKPGGIVYISYNAMPGWATCLPVQRLLYDVAEHGRERSDLKMRRAVAVLSRLQDADAQALKDNYFVKEILKSSSVDRNSYLVHEYLNASWHPQYHADVARDLAGAKLSFVGSADLLSNYLEFMLSPAQREIIEQSRSPQLRETLFDICVNRRFRQDVFIRGRRSMSQVRQAAVLKQLALTLTVPRSEFRYKLRVPAGEAEFSQAAFGPVVDALAERPRTVGELLELVSSRTDRGMPAGEIIVTLLGSKQAVPLRDGVGAADQTTADRLNRVLLDRIEAFDPNSEIGLAVAALGTGVKCNFSEALILRASLLGADDVIEHAAAEAMQVITSRGEKVLDDGKAVATEAEALDIVRKRVRQVTADKIAVWQRLLPGLKSPKRSAAQQ
jgi:SAM-dependent methyltransferase